jgi:hypothetical protein
MIIGQSRKFAAAALALSFIGSNNSVADQTTYTFSSQSIGAAASDRDVIVFIMGGAGATTPTISSVTIGGNAATLDVQTNQDSGSQGAACGIARLRVTSGTTATIAVTFSSGALNCFIAVYRLTGHVSGTPFATGSDVTDPINISINVPAGGVAVSGVALFRGGGTGDNVWTGLTEDVDASLSETTYDAGAASGSFASAQTPLSIQCAHAAAPTAMAGVAASW